MCPFSGEKANYIDPSSKIPYKDYEAYQTLKQVRDNQFIWSPIVGGFIHGLDMTVQNAPEGLIESTAGASEKEWLAWEAKNREIKRIESLLREENNVKRRVKEVEEARIAAIGLSSSAGLVGSTEGLVVNVTSAVAIDQAKA